MKARVSKIIYASLVACAFSFLPQLLLRNPSGSSTLNLFKSAAANAMAPGAFLALLAAGRLTNNISFFFVDLGNLIFYSAFAYLFLSVLAGLKATSREQRSLASASRSMKLYETLELRSRQNFPDEEPIPGSRTSRR